MLTAMFWTLLIASVILTGRAVVSRGWSIMWAAAIPAMRVSASPLS